MTAPPLTDAEASDRLAQLGDPATVGACDGCASPTAETRELGICIGPALVLLDLCDACRRDPRLVVVLALAKLRHQRRVLQ